MKALSVIDGGKNSESDVGTKSWAKKVRSRAKELVDDIDKQFLELSEILYKVYDVPIDGDAKNAPVYVQWGYKSFRDYAEQELGLHYKRAERLRFIYYRLEVELDGLDKGPLRARLLRLGLSKVRELMRVLTKRNAEKWIEMAENSNYQTVDAKVRKALDQKEDAEVEAAVRAEGDPVVKSNTLSHEKTQEEREDEAIEESMGPGKWGKDSGEQLFSKMFSFYPDQLETVKTALKRAGELTDKSSAGHNLSLICLDFLSNNDFTKASEEQRLRYVAKLEKLIGYKFVVVDPKTKEVLYGLSTLEKIAKED